MRIEAGSVVSYASDGRKCFADRPLTERQVDQLIAVIEAAGHEISDTTAVEFLDEGNAVVEVVER